MMLRTIQVVLFVAACIAQMTGVACASSQYAGVNLPTAAFGSDSLPGTYGKDYIYPAPSTLDYFAAKGMNVVRLPVLWERLQHRLSGALDSDEMRRLDAVIQHAASIRMQVILDVHNYARYGGAVIGSKTVPIAALGDLWLRLGERYKDNETVIFGIMNEPHGLPTETWLEAANIAVAEIRKTGAANLILVPGNGWSSARDWTSSSYGTSNSKVMLKIEDPANNFAYDVHQYFDPDFTGTSAKCQSIDVALSALKPVMEWSRQHDQRLFLGEFGVGPSKSCLTLLDRVMRFLRQNQDVWLGWAYWAGGEWWPADYFTNIQPADGQEKPQMSVLQNYLGQAHPVLD
jgi:endoglucanase